MQADVVEIIHHTIYLFLPDIQLDYISQSPFLEIGMWIEVLYSPQEGAKASQATLLVLSLPSSASQTQRESPRLWGKSQKTFSIIILGCGSSTVSVMTIQLCLLYQESSHLQYVNK